MLVLVSLKELLVVTRGGHVAFCPSGVGTLERVNFQCVSSKACRIHASLCSEASPTSACSVAPFRRLPSSTALRAATVAWLRHDLS